MKNENQDALAMSVLEWAFSGQKQMPRRQHNQVKAVTTQARLENRETGGKRRSRFWGLGPKWGRFA